MNIGNREETGFSYRRVAAICGSLAVAMMMPLSAQAASALAAGVPDNVAARGAAFGDGYNYSTRQAAEDRAMQECQKQGDAPQDTRDLCKIVAHFDNACVTVALDPTAGTPGFGWAVGATTNDANDQALEHCRETAGSGRAAYCVVTQSDCDGTARK
jgi:hypothetical protein